MRSGAITKMDQSKELPVATTNVEIPLQVTTKDPKKVVVGKKLAEWGRNNKKKLAQEAKAEESEPKLIQAYSIGAVMTVGVLGLLGYYIYQRSSPEADNDDVKVTPVRSVEVQTQRRANKLEMEQRIAKWTRKILLMTYTKQR